MGTFVVYRGGSMRTTGEHGAHMILQVAYEDGMRDLHYWSLRRSLNIKTDNEGPFQECERCMRGYIYVHVGM